MTIVPDDDAGLMGRVQAGDPAGAEALFTRYAGPMVGFTERMLGNRAEAEEVTQDVFLKMISRCDQYDGRASVSTWLFAIAANACRDRLRSAWRTTSVPLDAVPEPKGESSIEGGLLEREKRRAVRVALDRLTREQREALLLARYRGMPYAEVARTLGISEGAVKTRVFRAVEALRAHFAEEGGSRWTAVRS
ncbi:MAG: RNA polymerase sigma factor [Holophagales bacterium]|nr:RNA polymerase sigma factor [Holophagales bacterium]MBK9967541.1 RNA polymerase sigma factor [Holophagales bacterium]